MAHVPLCSNLIANWPTQKILAQPKASIHLLLKARKPVSNKLYCSMAGKWSSKQCSAIFFDSSEVNIYSLRPAGMVTGSVASLVVELTCCSRSF